VRGRRNLGRPPTDVDMRALLVHTQMPSLSEIAKHIGVSKTRVVELKQKGMPVSSLRAAKHWRDRQPLMRAPTNGKKNYTLAVVKLGRGRRVRRRVEPSNTGNTLEDLLNDATYMNKEAFTLVDVAMLGGDANLTAHYMRIYLSSLHMRLRAEKGAREEMERREVLVNKYDASALVRRLVDGVLRRLRRLPDEYGPRCNPQEPVMAYKILQEAVNEILLAGQEAIRGLDDPWKR
jgi:hypothetical protein